MLLTMRRCAVRSSWSTHVEGNVFVISEPGQIRDECTARARSLTFASWDCHLRRSEGLLLVDAVGEHQHALGVLHGPAGFGDLCDRLADLPVVVAATLSAVLRDRGHVDIEAMETDFCAGVAKEVLSEDDDVAGAPPGVDDAVPGADGLMGATDQGRARQPSSEDRRGACAESRDRWWG